MRGGRGWAPKTDGLVLRGTEECALNVVIPGEAVTLLGVAGEPDIGLDEVV